MRRSPRPIVLAVLVSLASSGVARALPSEQPSEAGMVDGKVRALAQVGPRIWAGGSFTQMQDASGSAVRAVDNLAAFDAATGAPDLSAPIPAVTRSSGTPVIYDLAVAPDGVTLYIAGAFTHVDGLARKNVAAIDTRNGAVLPFSVSPAISYSVLPTPAAIYVGTKKLQSFQADGSPTPGFAPPTAIVNTALRAHSTQPLFRDLALDGSTIVAACHCDSLSDAAGTRLTKALVKIDAATGAWVNWAPANLQVSGAAFGISLALGTDPATAAPTVYLGAGGSDFVAAYTLATGAQRWKTDTSGSAQSVAVLGDDLLVGGHYDFIEAPTSTAGCGDAGNPNPNGDCFHAPALTAVDRATGRVALDDGAPWNPGVCCKYNGVWAVLAHGGGERVSVGGEFTKLGGSWSLSAGTWKLTGFRKQTYVGQLPPPPDPVLEVSLAGGGNGAVTSVPAGIDCGATCSASFVAGTQVALQAVPDTNSTFAGWSGACGGTAGCVVDMSAPASVIATFEPIVRTLTVTRGGSGSGGVASAPAGIDCGADCDETFAQGSAIALAAIAEPGSAFAGWTGACAGSDETCDLTITGDLATGATFQPAVTLDVTRAGTGAGRVTSEPAGIDCGDACSAGFAPGQTVTLTPDPDVASTFEGWSGGCAGTGPCIVEMTQARSVSATFGQGSGCGRILFTSARDGNDEVYVMRPDGSAVTRLTNHSATDKDPAWSPDCSKIAFSSSRSGNPEIWVMDADGGGLARLTTVTGADTDPTWSPDGSQIAFVSGRTGNSEIYTMTAAGAGQANRTSDAANDRAPDWSPDGASLAFASNRTGNFQVFSMPADGGGAAVRLTNGLGVCDAPAFAPGGSSLAITSTSSGTAQIWTIDLDGSNAARVSSGGGTESHPSWAPDGALVAFGSNASGASRVWAIAPDGSAASMLSDGAGADTTPSWS